MPRPVICSFVNYGGYDEQTIFTHQFWWKYYMDQRNNEHSTDQQPKKNEEQESSDSTKHEATLCATCERNFTTSRGLIQH